MKYRMEYAIFEYKSGENKLMVAAECNDLDVLLSLTKTLSERYGNMKGPLDHQKVTIKDLS